MDFGKVKEFDLGEWRRIHNHIYGIAEAAVRKDKRLYSGNEFLLTGVDVDDVIEESIELAMAKIGQIKSEAHLRGFVARAALFKARTRLKAKLAASNVDRVTESLEAKLKKHPNITISDDEVAPDVILLLSELDVLFHELCSMFLKEDLELLWRKGVLEMKEKDIGAEIGKSTTSIGNRIIQARNRMKKSITSNPRAIEIIEQLGLKAYLNE